MLSFFLKAKHWQLALLFFAAPICLYIVAFTVLITMIDSVNNNEIAATFMSILLLAAIIGAGSLFAWFYAMGTRLHPKLPADMPMPLQRFKVFFTFPLVYLLLIFIGLIAMVASEQHLDGEPVTAEYAYLLPLFLICHFFSIFCIFYVMYFVAKSLKAVQLQREVHFSDYAGEFFLLWFNIIGIWLIQPKINEIFSGRQDVDHWTPVLDQ